MTGRVSKTLHSTKTVVWRADRRAAIEVESSTGINWTVAAPIRACNKEAIDCDWTPKKFTEFKERVTGQISENKLHLVSEEITRLDPRRGLDGEREMAAAWRVGITEIDANEKKAEERWQHLGCVADERLTYSVRC